MQKLLADSGFQEQVRVLVGSAVAPGDVQPVGGGCIHGAFRLRAGDGAYFLKCNVAACADQFAAELDGLQALGGRRALRAPGVLGTGVHAGTAWLLLEWLDLQPLDGNSAARLGAALAGLHDEPREHHGWSRDNYIGVTPQPNRPAAGWVAFFRARRLDHQLALARLAGALDRPTLRSADRLLERLDAFFADGEPVPSLLHGDLWGGNVGRDGAGRPVLFDPAVYCGDSETDLAMTELFGGFPEAFYAAYRESRPLRPGYAQRRPLYQLYHVLNHLNLFGGGYGRQAARMIHDLAGMC